MILIYCIDERNGLLFNNRRQSRDRVLIERIMNFANGKMFINGFSKKLFDGYDVTVSNDFLSLAKDGDYCFVEDADADIIKAEKVILYNWNRHYPSDKKFNFDLIKAGFTLVSTDEFTGSSHDKITEQIYVKGV